MIRLNSDAVNALLESHYVSSIQRDYGDAGIKALRRLLEALHNVYYYIAPENLQHPLVLFKTLEDRFRPIPDAAITIVNTDTLTQEVRGRVFIQILDNDQMLLWRDIAPDIGQLSEQAIVYEYNTGSEIFILKGLRKEVPRIAFSGPSTFAIPTFTDLRSALEHYRTKSVRYCSCPILGQVWSDNDRIFFKNAQEFLMRQSLTYFLKATLRDDAEVRPEQVVDESHPVDIKVTWGYAQRLALIEIKWLGTPRYDDGHLGKAYSDSRANDGAAQLSDYLDKNARQVPTHITRGYLVIIDGRRRGLREDTATIDTENGLYYQNKEIEFDPRFHEIRADFEVPIRMFVEPICHIS